MGWFTSSSSSRPGYARSHAGSSYSSSSRHGGHGHHSSTSRYGRSPREGYMNYLYHKVRRLFHKLMAYAKRHPYKVFFMVIMPLVSGGVLHKLARQFGVNLPQMGNQGHRGASHGGSAGGYYGSEGYGGQHGGSGGAGGGLGGIAGSLGGVQGLASGIGGLASLAKMAQGFI